MALSGWRRFAVVALLLGFSFGCAVPSSAYPPLTADAAKNTLDSWNPNYCKVVEFYGMYKSEEGATQTAYVLLGNPGEAAAKPQVFAGRFRLLTLPNGSPRWFLVSLISHSSGLSRRQGWDNLMIPVKEASPPASK
jgi:hypothetical protein